MGPLILAVLLAGGAERATAEPAYEPVSLAELRRNARKLAGSRVVVTGKVVALSDDLAAMFEGKGDPDRVWLRTRSAPQAARAALMGSCRSLDRPCDMAVRGRVNLSGPELDVIVEQADLRVSR